MDQEWTLGTKDSSNEILEGSDCSLNDNLMDAGQRLIFKVLSSLKTYQSVLNCQKNGKRTSQYQVITFNYCMIIIVIGHWDSVQVEGFKYVIAFEPIWHRFPSNNWNQYNNHFALPYASILLDGKFPTNFRFLVQEIRAHFIKCLKDVTLHPFPEMDNTAPSSNKAKDFLF